MSSAAFRAFWAFWAAVSALSPGPREFVMAWSRFRDFFWAAASAAACFAAAASADFFSAAALDAAARSALEAATAPGPLEFVMAWSRFFDTGAGALKFVIA